MNPTPQHATSRRAGPARRRPHDTATPVYVISVAADLTGVHAQTLRNYERQGLLTPARSRGGNRRYSDADLTRIRRISELTDDGVALTGVRRILDLEQRLAEITPPVTALLTRRAAQLPPRRPSRRHYTPTASIVNDSKGANSHGNTSRV